MPWGLALPVWQGPRGRHHILPLPLCQVSKLLHITVHAAMQQGTAFSMCAISNVLAMATGRVCPGFKRQAIQIGWRSASAGKLRKYTFDRLQSKWLSSMQAAYS